MLDNKWDKKNAETGRKKVIKKEVNRFLNDNFKWFIIIVIILIFIFSYFKLIKPRYEEAVKLVGVIIRQEGINTEKKQKELEKIRDFLFAYSQIEAKHLEKINSVLPFKYNQEELFTELNQIVSKNGLILQSVSLNKESQVKGAANYLAGKIKKIKINLNVKGTDYNALKNFLFSLENNLKLMDVTNINFSPSGETTSLVIDTYYLE